MAKYDREFLVPYLEDICALELSKNKLLSKIDNARIEIQRINEKALESVEPPKLEQFRSASDMDGFGYGCLGIVLDCIGLIMMFVGLASGSQVFALIFALLCIVPGIVFIIKSFTQKEKVNDEIQRRNEEKERDHALAEMSALVEVQPKTEAVKRKIEVWEQEISKIEVLLEQIYSVNVIPRWYRDLYPAVYLYDWFSNSMADDLDIALNTLVLEQVKDKLDIIICKQAEMIINQRVMLANQRKSMEQAERHRTELLRRLDRIHSSMEDQKMYLGMIEANTAATAYFSAAKYLK